MEDFKRENLFNIYFKMTQEEVITYYQNLRKQLYLEDEPIRGIEIRKKIYKIIRLILKIDALCAKRNVSILSDSRNLIYDYKTKKISYIQPSICRSKIQRDKSRIYTCTHIGRYDIESALYGVNDNCYFIMGDPGETYQNVDGLLLRANGVSWFEMYNKFDAHTVNVRQTKVLSQGGNELNFGEAAYCLDPVNPVGKIHPGVVKRAIKTDSRIIPVSMEQYENKGIKEYILNIGKSINLTGAEINEAETIALFIQKEMIDLKREIWYFFGGSKPSEEEFINDPEGLQKYKRWVDFIMRDVPSYYTIEDIMSEVYSPSQLTIDSLEKIGYLKKRK